MLGGMWDMVLLVPVHCLFFVILNYCLHIAKLLYSLTVLKIFGQRLFD